MLNEIKEVVVQTITEWLDDNMMLHAAGLAFYTIFSIAPLLLIIVAISGFFFGEQATAGQLSTFLVESVGPELAKTIEGFVVSVSEARSGIAATLIGTGILLFAATTVITQLKESLNAIWNVKAKDGQGIKMFFLNRLLSLVLIIIFSLTLIATIFIDAFLSLIAPYLETILPDNLSYWTLINNLIFLAVGTILFSIIYKMLPDIKVRWSDVVVGAFVTALLFLLGRNLVTFYLGSAATTSTYGAAGSFVIFLIWVYYNMMVIFLGAEFTNIYTKRYGSKIKPGKFVRWRQESPSLDSSK